MKRCPACENPLWWLFETFALVVRARCISSAIILVGSICEGHDSDPMIDSRGGLEGMSLEELMRQKTVLHHDSNTASGIVESFRDSPASMLVVDSSTIARRGYDSLDDLLSGLPGFDTIHTNGTSQTVAYQRGYRTPWTQRTLFLVNGKVDNNLWNHTAQISRQYPMAMIDRVEVLNGPAGAVYGPNAFLGVINVITRDSSALSDGNHYARADFSRGSFDSEGIDIAAGGREGAFSYDVGLKLFESDEAGLEDYSSWGFTEESLLSDPQRWGPGIGLGVDPATGRLSPAGDIDVDGEVEAEELYNGAPLGQYRDPTENFGFIGEARMGNWELGLIKWETDEGYGPYYSFADAQPGVSWIHESTQAYLNHHTVIGDFLSSSSELVYRDSRVGGEWVESFGDSISLSNWNSYSEAWRFEQEFAYAFSREFSLNGGLKWEHRNLSKLYLICNYWDDVVDCSDFIGIGNGGSSVLPAHEISSENPSMTPPRMDEKFNPDFNIDHTNDYGAFVQGLWDKGDWRLNASLRWDKNDDFAAELSPRLALVHHGSSSLSYKIAYAEAYQEPSRKDLFGGWNGRNSNPELMPETVQNLEFMVTHQTENWMHDVSVYAAEYGNVIAGAENVYGRSVYGFEYKGSYRMANFLENSRDITGTLYYTFTDSQSEAQFNNATGGWVLQKGETGDIAPHKVNFSINVPMRRKWNLNVTANWVSERQLFSQNPLRSDSNPNRQVNRKAEAYTKVDANFMYDSDRYRVGLKIENLFEEDYLLPGVESASSGDDFSRDVDGFQNSLIPQVKGRVYTVVLSLKF